LRLRAKCRRSRTQPAGLFACDFWRQRSAKRGNAASITQFEAKRVQKAYLAPPQAKVPQQPHAGRADPEVSFRGRGRAAQRHQPGLVQQEVLFFGAILAQVGMFAATSWRCQELPGAICGRPKGLVGAVPAFGVGENPAPPDLLFPLTLWSVRFVGRRSPGCKFEFWAKWVLKTHLVFRHKKKLPGELGAAVVG
jgi:hypothetical protein